jgi:hypothetical protein
VTLIARAWAFTIMRTLLRELERAPRTCVAPLRCQIFAASRDERHALSGLWQEAADATTLHRAACRIGLWRRCGNFAPDRQQCARARATGRCRRPASAARPAGAACGRSRGSVRNADATLERVLATASTASAAGNPISRCSRNTRRPWHARRLMSASPWVAQYLTQHPILLDELLDTRTLLCRAGLAGAHARTARQLDDARATRTADGHAAPLQARPDHAPARARIWPARCRSRPCPITCPTSPA